MKNNELHNFLRDLHATDVQTPKFEQGLRRSILNKSRKQSFGRRLAQGFSLRKDPFLRARQRYMSYGSMAMIALLVLSLTAYTYHFSPKAEAEQVIDQSLVTLEAVPAVQLDSIEAQLGDDPAAALKEAKSASDIKVITKDDFVALGKEAKSVIATSLSSDPSAPKITSVSVNGAPSGALVRQGTISGSGGAPASGAGYGYANITSSAATSSTPANAPTYSTGGAVPADTTTVSSDGTTISSGTFTAVAGSAAASGPTTTLPAPGESGMVTVTGGEFGGSSSGPTYAVSGTATAVPTSAQIKGFTAIKPVTASTYLQYTNSKGQTVVLSLDAKGLPIYKTIFIGIKS